MATSQNRINTRVGAPTSAAYATGSLPENNTSKKNYTGLRYGNDHGSINFGHVHKMGDCTADILLQASDGRHSISLDKDGQRKGCTQFTAPGRISIESGEDLTETEDTLFIHAWHGNICIIAQDGKLRLQGTDIELVAVGEGGSKGNIRMKATENIEIDGKKVLINAKTMYKLATSGKAEIAANSCMNIYSSVIRGVTDAVANKDSKVGGRKFQVSQAIF
jgi:hypothetical protein